MENLIFVQLRLFFLRINKKNCFLRIALCIAFSLIYAICSQLIIPLPFNAIPISIQPLPIFLATLLFGWIGVHAYMLYLVQGAFGAPVFAACGAGLLHLCGPSGGYLIGFLCAGVFLALTRTYQSTSFWGTCIKLQVANFIVFGCGIAWLSQFVGGSSVLDLGFFPFVFGDFVCKAIAATVLYHAVYKKVS